MFVQLMKDTAQTGKYIRESMKYLVLLLLPMVFIISASSSSLIQLFYSGKYAPAAHPLAVGLNWVLIPAYQLNGAAIAMSENSTSAIYDIF
jgi:O-antigen/teichoic acid export membrane protein